ncbi:MAG: hypothetical protein M0008_02670 [Actinomycetota bacterium]|nr:hypothetical protein [Actinomycetota bacterium]
MGTEKTIGRNLAGDGTMFIHDFVHVRLSCDAAKARIAADRGHWIDQLATAASDDGGALRLKVGPALGPSEPMIGKEVHCKLGDPRDHGDGFVVPLEWEATGIPGLFPRLEGDLEIAPLGSEGSQISLVGRYDPPLGRAGRLLNSALGHRVAEATIRSFLLRLASALDASEPGSPTAVHQQLLARHAVT